MSTLVLSIRLLLFTMTINSSRTFHMYVVRCDSSTASHSNSFSSFSRPLPVDSQKRLRMMPLLHHTTTTSTTTTTITATAAAAAPSRPVVSLTTPTVGPLLELPACFSRRSEHCGIHKSNLRSEGEGRGREAKGGKGRRGEGDVTSKQTP